MLCANRLQLRHTLHAIGVLRLAHLGMGYSLGRFLRPVFGVLQPRGGHAGKVFNRIGNVWLRGGRFRHGRNRTVAVPVHVRRRLRHHHRALVNGNDAAFLPQPLTATMAMYGCLYRLAPAIMLLKVFATIASNSSGGVAGDFAPTVFAVRSRDSCSPAASSAPFGVNFPWGFSVSYGEPPVHWPALSTLR